MAGIEFDWDDGNRAKCAKHGVSAAEIEFALSGPVAVRRPDVLHSSFEPRFQAVGRTSGGRHVFLVYTVRRRSGQNLIRPISARYMHQEEVRRYEETSS